jgi:hypothetical protein
VPRFNDQANAPATRTRKNAVFGRAANISFSGDLMTVEFEMKDYSLARPNAIAGQPDVFDTASIGGGFVATDLARCILNPGDGDGVQFLSDPEMFLYPGDQISFDAEAVRDIALTCVSAKAFSGSADAAAVAPHVDATGIPEFVRDNYNKRDVALFEISPQNGEVIRDYVTGIGASEQDIPLDFVGHGAVAPPTIDEDENSTGYLPTLKKTDKNTGTTSTVPTNEYLWEPNTGTFYIDTSAWAAGDYVLFTDMWVFDVREIYPCEASSAFESLIDGLCEGVYETTISTTDADYEIKVDSDRPATGIISHEVSSPLEVLSAPYVPYDLDDGLEHQEEKAGYNLTKTYMDPGSPSTFEVGCVPFREASGNYCSYFNRTNAYAFSEIGEFGRWSSDEVEQARVDVSLKNGVITEEWDDLSFDEFGDPVVDAGTSTSDTSIDLTMTLYMKTSGSAYDLQSTGETVSLTVTRINIAGTDYLRGTVDITNILKYVLDNITTEDITFLLSIGKGEMPSGTTKITDLAAGWIEYFYSTRSGDYTEGIRAKILEFDRLDIGNLYIQTKASALENIGPELPRTSEGLVVDNPDLTFDPT